jgi:hypothetical protein
MSGSLECTELQMDESWPQDAGVVLSALEAGRWSDERRGHARLSFRVKAMLWLFADNPGAPARILFTRDADQRGLGFITRDRLPLGYGGILRVSNPKAAEKTLSIPCTIIRCRQTAPEWYEGALQFNRDQSEFWQEKTPQAPEQE